MEHGEQEHSLCVFVDGEERRVSEGDFGVRSSVGGDNTNAQVMEKGFKETIKG